MWPAVGHHVVEIKNELYREWDSTSVRSFDVRQTVPASISKRRIPIDRNGEVDRLLMRAEAAVHELTRRAIEAGVAGLGGSAGVQATKFQDGGAQGSPGAAAQLSAAPLNHLVAVLVRSDALASSRIEEVHASSEQLAVVLADLDEQGDAIVPIDAAETHLVAGAVEAVREATSDLGRAVSVEWLHSLHRSLLRVDRTIEPRHLGAWRDCPVWIGTSRQHAEFEGPPFEDIERLMRDLIDFVHRRDLPALTRAAIAHAQFETIHPYVDGNGRVGRALIHQIVGAPAVPVPVAHGLLTNVDDYVAGLTAYRTGDLAAWLTVFFQAVERGARAALDLIDALAALRTRYHERVPTRAGSVTRQLLDDLIGQPVVTSLMVQRTYGVSAPRASQLTAQLTEAGVLRRSTVWAPTSRKVWVAGEVVATIDAIVLGAPRSLG